MTDIKEVVEFRGEFTMKGGTLGFGKLLGISIRRESVIGQPAVALLDPSLADM
jgi:hypothetical protein